MSAAAVEWFGRPREELVGQPLRALSADLADVLASHRSQLDAARPEDLAILEVPATVELDGETHSLQLTMIAEADAAVLSWTPLEREPVKTNLPSQLMAVLPDIVVVCDRQGMFRQVSRSLGALLGYSDEELTSRPFLDFVVEEDRPTSRADFAAMLAGRETVIGYENRYRTADGGVRWLRWSARLASDGLIYATARDITAPKLGYRQRALMFKSLAHSRHGVVMTDAHGVLEWCNRGFSEICGYAIEEIVGKRLGRLLQGPGTDLVEAERIRACVRQGVGFVSELLNYHKSGRPYWIRIEAEPLVDDDGRLHFLGLQVDVTEERRRADALAASEARLRATLTASNDAIYWLAACRDERGEIVDFEFLDINPAVEVELGMTRDQLLGRRINELFPINRSGGFFERYKAVAETGESFRDDYEIPHDQPAPGYYQHLVMKVGDGVVIFNRNLTEDRTREVAQRQSQRMAALGRLASGIAHDFNNVLAGIGFSAELLQSQVREPESQKIVSSILKSTERAGEFVKRVLMFARRTERELAPWDLEEAFSESWQMLGRSLPAAVELHAELASKLRAMVDVGQLEQLITNLVTNARQAIEGHGNIWVELREVARDELPATLQLPDEDAERCALLSVRDDGVGIDPAALEHVFDPFYSTKPVEQGTGLGLAIVHGIVHDHKGRVSIESELGVGTIFRVVLPLLTSDPDTPITATAAPPELEPGELGVLLVDDDELIVESLGAALEIAGYDVVVHDNAARAMSELRTWESRVGVAVIDLNMPGMTGLELATHLREELPELKILLMTGGGTLLDDDQLRAAGVVGILDKPFSSRQLRTEIARLFADRADDG